MEKKGQHRREAGRARWREKCGVCWNLGEGREEVGEGWARCNSHGIVECEAGDKGAELTQS